MIRTIIKYCITICILIGAGLALFEAVILPVYVGYNNEHYLPDLRGKYLETAQRELISNGFTIEVINKDYSEDYKPGTIISMAPAPFIKVKEGRTIKLTVAGDRADLKIPEFTGTSLRGALLQLEQMGLELDTVMSEFNSSFAEGLITYQSPREGQMVKVGSKVTFMVSKGDPPDVFRVPELVNKSLNKAKIAISESGLKLGDIIEEYHPSLIPNTVIDQSLTAGMRLSIPARIDLVISTDKLSKN